MTLVEIRLPSLSLVGLMVIVASLMGENGQSVTVKLVRALSIFLGISICFLAATRGQLIFSIFLSILLYPVAYEIKSISQFFTRTATIGVIAGIMLVIGKLFLFKTDSSARFSADELASGFSGRMMFARTMMSEYSANPSHYLQGLGTGSFNAIVQHDGDNYLYPHNLIVEVLTHHGLIGFCLLIGIFIVTGVHTLKLIKLIPTGQADRGAVAIVIAISGYLTLIAMKQGSFLLVPIPFYMYLITTKLYLRSSAKETQEFCLDEDGYAGDLPPNN